MCCSKHHFELNENGKGKCSVPMWCDGVQVGFCDKTAFGKPTRRMNNINDYYVPGLACPMHGGPKEDKKINNTGIRLEVKQKEQLFKIVKIKALKADELPKEYLKGDAPVVFQKDDDVLQTKDLGWISLGAVLTRDALQNLLTYIRVAGDHLTQVNKKLKEKQREQENRIVFVDGRGVKKTQRENQT